jgi:hypothetical protein
MLIIKMIPYIRQFITMQVDQLSALFTFQMKACMSGHVTVLIDIFKACGTVGIDYVFIDDALIHKALQLTIYSRLTYILPLLLKVGAYIICGDMLARN